jgi:hypothetical protein
VNDLVPLRILARNEAEVSVLRSADADRAPPEAVQRVAASLGVSTSLMALSSTAGAASAVGVAGAGLVKSLLVGVGAGTFVGGTLLTISVMNEPSAVPRPAPDRFALAQQQSFHKGAPTLAAPPPTAMPVTGAAAHTNVSLESRASSTRVVPSEQAQSPATIVPAPMSNTTSSGADEVAQLDRARRLAAAGKANDALRVLEGYALRWPDGVMALEASVVRVEVELARGNKAAAERYARALIAAHPNTGHARKVASLLDRPHDE